MPEGEFQVLPEVTEFLHSRVEELVAEAAAWDKKFQAFLDADQSRAKQIDAYLNRTVPADIKEQLLAAAPVDKPVASRASSGVVLPEGGGAGSGPLRRRRGPRALDQDRYQGRRRLHAGESGRTQPPLRRA